jgi:SAM-dependent methyltransferase
LPEELLEMVRGFQPSRILLSALELELFSAVAELGPTATASEIARRLDADLRATEVLLNALVALKMLSKTAGIFANSALAARYLVRGDPADSRDALRHHSNLWTTWSQLTECVRRGKPARWEEMAERGSDWTTSFIAAMHKNAALRAPLLVQAIGAQGVNRLLDVGGGSGAYSITFALANPGLSAQVFDLPSVIPIAEQQIAAAGLQNRVSTRVGDLREDVFESGFDLVLLSAICHMLGPDENRDLFRRAYAALLPGGRLAIQDHVMHEDKTAPRAGALFAVNMLVGTPQGGTYSWFEYRNFLEQVGFEEVEKVDLPGPNQLVLANKGRSA